jgi:predicted NAD/FAD-binding protein
MMAALWSASLQDVLQFPAVQLISFMCNHQMLQLMDRPTWKTVNGRSQTYTTAVQSILGNSVHLNSKVHSIEKQTNGKYKIYTGNNNDGKTTTDHIEYDDIIFACHPPQASEILQNSTTLNNTNVSKTIELLNHIEYKDNIIYVHSDTNLMPSKERAWASWNCIGNEQLLMEMYNPSGSSKYKATDAFEGASSGFGKSVPTTTNSIGTSNHVDDNDGTTALDGENGRFKAVYIT